MTKTKVVNLKKEKYDIYIGRPSPYGNVFEIGEDGTREEVVEKYRAYAKRNMSKMNLRHLKGKRLGCYCKPLVCHGDVLVEMVEELYSEKA